MGSHAPNCSLILTLKSVPVAKIMSAQVNNDSGFKIHLKCSTHGERYTCIFKM